jgi:hypothetical protein
MHGKSKYNHNKISVISLNLKAGDDFEKVVGQIAHRINSFWNLGVLNQNCKARNYQAGKRSSEARLTILKIIENSFFN